jgi:hypothetical protein
MIDHTKFIGKIYGNLKVIGVGPTNKHRKKLMIVQCVKHINEPPFQVVKQSLVNGSTTGCKQCWLERHTTHGYSASKTYNAFKEMVNRIHQPAHRYYHNYGGRGLTMDPRYHPNYNNQGWKGSFENFLHDNGEIPEGLTLDRKNNNKGYWKDNIRYIPDIDQKRNTSYNVVNEEIVRQIRIDFEVNGMSQANIMRKYDISRFQAHAVVRYKTWANITI